MKAINFIELPVRKDICEFRHIHLSYECPFCNHIKTMIHQYTIGHTWSMKTTCEACKKLFTVELTESFIKGSESFKEKFDDEETLQHD
jgi:hypothetical protein